LSNNSRKETILVVDDVAPNLIFLSAILNKQGFETHCLSNGHMALEEAKKQPPDLILLDIRMPEMDGYEVCRRLKKDPKTRDIPVIFISALDAVQDKLQAFSVGGADYITKPFRFEEVVARVETHLALKRLQKKIKEEVSVRNAIENELRKLKSDLEHRVLQRTLELDAEHKRSEQLLFNVLPQSVVERLKFSQENITDSFKDVTVIFADIVDFTKISANSTSDELANMLHHIFSAFDQLVEKHQLEKIKTIGDAYMVVGGLPVERPDHAEAAAEMALDMLEALEKMETVLRRKIQVRIGINSGPVTAGVIGKKKFIYDLWGDTVNTASRMESTGLPGTIQVTEETYRRLKYKYTFKSRGLIDVKGKGKMKVYILTGRRMKNGG